MTSGELYLRVIASLIVALSRRCSIYPEEDAVAGILRELEPVLGKDDVERLRELVGEFVETLRRALRNGDFRRAEKNALEVMLSL